MTVLLDIQYQKINKQTNKWSLQTTDARSFFPSHSHWCPSKVSTGVVYYINCVLVLSFFKAIHGEQGKHFNYDHNFLKLLIMEHFYKFF